MSLYTLRGRVYYCTHNSKIKYLSSSSEDEDDSKEDKAPSKSKAVLSQVQQKDSSKDQSQKSTITKNKFEIRKNLNL